MKLFSVTKNIKNHITISVMIFSFMSIIAHAEDERQHVVYLPSLKVDGEFYPPEDIIASMQFPIVRPDREFIYDVERLTNADGMKIDLQERFVFAIYKDGFAVWSKDLINGGPPFYSGSIDIDKFNSFIKIFESKYFFRTYSKRFLLYTPLGELNRPSSSIFVRNGQEFIVMQSGWEFHEQHPDKVLLSNGQLIRMKPTENKAEILSREDKDYIQRRQDWNEIKSNLIELMDKSSEQKLIEDIEVRKFYGFTPWNIVQESSPTDKAIWEKTQDERDHDMLISLPKEMQNKTKAQNPLNLDDPIALEKLTEDLKRNALNQLPCEQHKAYEEYFEKNKKYIKTGEQPPPFQTSPEGKEFYPEWNK